MLQSTIIGNKIRVARNGKNLSQVQLAQQLFISSQAVGKWERGESMPDIITFNRIAEILEVDLNYFSESFQTKVSNKPVAEALNENRTETLRTNLKKKSGWNMSNDSWVDADFSGINNLFEKFVGSNIKNCKFIGSEMAGLLLRSNDVGRCDFTNSNLDGSRFSGSNILNSIFKECTFKSSEFTASEIKGCNFSGADLNGAIFKSGSFIKNIISGVIWENTSFHSMQFTDIVFEGKLNGCSFESCRFSKVTFQNAILTNTFFKYNNLKRVIFIDCKADTLTYAFLKNEKADMAGITLVTR